MFLPVIENDRSGNFAYCPFSDKKHLHKKIRKPK